MVRRVVVGANSAGQVGIYVSRSGWDAWSAPESQLLFSSTQRHFMIVQSGSLQMGAPGVAASVSFIRPPGQIPFVLCGVFNPKPTTVPVIAYVSETGFDAYPALDFAGNYPAAGAWVQYYAFLKSQ